MTLTPFTIYLIYQLDSIRMGFFLMLGISAVAAVFGFIQSGALPMQQERDSGSRLMRTALLFASLMIAVLMYLPTTNSAATVVAIANMKQPPAQKSGYRSSAEGPHSQREDMTIQ